jgi:hypothetical protein
MGQAPAAVADAVVCLCCSMDGEPPGLENSGGEEQLGSNAFGSDGSGTNVHSFEVGVENGRLWAVVALWQEQPFACPPGVRSGSALQLPASWR